MNSPARLTDEEVLAYTQGKRKELVEKITANGMPGDKSEQVVLLEALSGMDRAALSTLKMKSEERIGNQQAQAAAFVASVLTQTGRNKVFQVDHPVEREIPSLGNDVPTPQIVDGELDQTATQLDYATFMSKMSPGETE